MTRQCNEISVGNGLLSLKRDESGGSEYPLHIYPLDSIVNDGNQPIGGYKLNSNGYDFDTLGCNVEGGGLTGQSHANMGNINAMGKNILHKNYTDIKLLLWGHANRKTTFNLSLVRFKDEDLDVTLAPITTNGETQEKRQLFFTHKMLKKIMSNPIISNVTSKTSRQRFNVVWSKSYTIRETLSTESQAKHRVVKIFRKENKSLSYKDSPEVVLDLAADSVVHEDPSEPPTTYPSQSRLKTFLIVTSNVNAEDDVNTYDIQIKSKYTMIGNV